MWPAWLPTGGSGCAHKVTFSQVNQELKQVRGLVTGVPYFVFNKGQGDQEVHISGAQVGHSSTSGRLFAYDWLQSLCLRQ